MDQVFFLAVEDESGFTLFDAEEMEYFPLGHLDDTEWIRVDQAGRRIIIRPVTVRNVKPVEAASNAEKPHSWGATP